MDIHGENVTETACRAVKEAIFKSCRFGFVEIPELEDLEGVLVDIHVANAAVTVFINPEM